MLAVALGGLLVGPVLGAAADKARLERQSFLQATELWSLKLRAAHTADERRAIWAQQPSASAHAEKLWAIIKPSLGEEWTLEPAAWILTSAPQLRDAVEAIRTALEQHHLRSSKVAPLAYALTAVPDPRSLALLEKVGASNPRAEVRGVAALGTAILLKGLGEDPENMKRRLGLLRQAIIDSANVDLGGRTVAKVAEDELFIIANLTKGRIAPQLSGTDVAGKPFKLSDCRGKVVVLLFWATWNREADKTLELTRSLAERLAGKPFEIIGINGDDPAVLRDLHANRSVTWRNLPDPKGELAATYRITDWPVAYVLDRDGRIQFIGTPGTFVDLAAESLING